MNDYIRPDWEVFRSIHPSCLFFFILPTRDLRLLANRTYVYIPTSISPVAHHLTPNPSTPCIISYLLAHVDRHSCHIIIPTVPIMNLTLSRTTGAMALTDEYSQDHERLIIYENLLGWDGMGGAGLG